MTSNIDALLQQIEQAQVPQATPSRQSMPSRKAKPNHSSFALGVAIGVLSVLAIDFLFGTANDGYLLKRQKVQPQPVQQEQQVQPETTLRSL